MKLQSPTLILVFIAIALGSFVAVTELRPTDSGEGGESEALFKFEEEEVRSLVVETASRTLKFEKAAVSSDRDRTNDADAPDEVDDDVDGEETETEADEPPETAIEWQMRSPDEAPADDSAVVFLVNLMASGVSDRVFEVAPENLDDFGFDAPLAEVAVTLENQESHRLILGNYDFNGTNIYAQAISSSEDEAQQEDEQQGSTDDESVQVFIVSTSFDSAVNRPLDEWKRADEDQSEEQDDDAEDENNASDSADPPSVPAAD